MAEPEPILVSDASRKAMLRYLETGVSVHEILADAIFQAEQRGVQATLTALGSQSDEHGRMFITTGYYDQYGLETRIKRELGR